MLQALPMKADIEALILRIEEAHSRDITEVRSDLHSLTERVDTEEAAISTLELRVSALEHSQTSQATLAGEMQLHLEEMEDRSRRNNLRLQGLPEATGTEDLPATVTAIFHIILEAPPLTLQIDRVHRALGPKSTDPDKPRDVLCRLHRYSQKHIILRKSWDHDPIEFDGATLQILPDMSRATLQRRALLKPVLESARRNGFTYRWGYPLAVTFRKAQVSFTLRSPADLPALFTFMNAEPVQVQN